MADEFQAEVCGGNWWNPSRNMFGSSPCSSGGILDLGTFGWPSDFLDIKSRTSHDDHSASANSDGSIVIHDLQKPDSSSNNNTSIDSTLQILGIGLTSPPTTIDWNQSLVHNGRPSDQSNYQTILQEDQNSSMHFLQERGIMLDDCNTDHQIQKDWNNNLKRNFSAITEEDSSINPSKSTSFPISSISYGYSSNLLQNLFDSEPDQPQQSLYENRPINYPSTTNHQNQFSSALPKFSPLQKLQNTANSLQFSTNPNFCAASAPALNDFRASFFPSAQSQQFLPSTFNEKPNLPNLSAKFQANNSEVQTLGSMAKKTGNEPAFKRPRIETPSPLPTFKVRKEKLGDRVTALQQLVSPFGKTDTASVLHEAIEYIKFLHDQVNMLSTPYLKNGSPIQRQQANSDKVSKDQEGLKEDLKSRGLCLVPISSTFPVAAETTTDFWTPTFGGTFR